MRILRSMCEFRVPLSSVEIAESASLSDAGARNALGRLVQTGLVIREGRGRQQLYSLRHDPLKKALQELFEQELRRYEEIERDLKKIIRSREKPPRVVWLGPPAKDGRIEVRFMSKAQDVGPTRTELQQAVNEVERRYDIVVDVRGYSRADDPDIDSGRTIHAEIAHDESERLNHAEHDARAEIRSRRIADLLHSRPDIILRATRHLERVLRDDQGMAGADIKEWLNILETYSPLRLRAFLKSNSERSQRLRQSSPLFAVLEAHERAEIDIP